MKVIASTLLVLVFCFLFTGLGCLSARQQATVSQGAPLRGAPPQASEIVKVPDGQTVLLKAHAKGGTNLPVCGKSRGSWQIRLDLQSA
jgi:hypothetical protein